MNVTRTDLAMEAKKIWEDSAEATSSLKGVKASEDDESGYHVTTVDILDDEGSKTLCKPIGRYITVDIGELIRRENGSFQAGAMTIASRLRDMMELTPASTILVAGLGNRAVTPDAIGPAVSDSVLATRHLVQSSPQQFPFFKRVSVMSPGVLGTTGLESGDMIKSVAEDISADCIIVIDALCSASLDRLCRTVQITDTGITPGSGVGNARAEISRNTTGVPVVAVGVPTVTTIYSAAAELFGDIPDGESKDKSKEIIVTPRDIDMRVKEISKLVAYAINLAVHNGLTVEDLDMLV